MKTSTTTQSRISNIENQIRFAAQRTAIHSEMHLCSDGLDHLFINVSSLFRYYGIFLELEEVLRLSKPTFKAIDKHLNDEFISLKGAAALILVATQ